MQPNQANQQPKTVPMQPATHNGVPPASNQPQQIAASNPNSTQNSLLINEIRDGIVIMRDGSFRSVVMAKSINFDLMSEQEQEAVEFSYQGFLNSLYFDVQIVIRSRKIDMRPYLEKLNNIHNNLDNMLLGMLMEDYIYFISDLVSQTNIMSKQFYLVVNYYPIENAKQALQTSKKFLETIFEKKSPVVTIDEPSLLKAKTELKNRVAAILDGLQQLGVQGAPLDTQELIELYYNTYNPDTASRQTLNNLEPLNTPVITKGAVGAQKPYINGGMQ